MQTLTKGRAYEKDNKESSLQDSLYFWSDVEKRGKKK